MILVVLLEKLNLHLLCLQLRRQLLILSLQLRMIELISVSLFNGDILLGCEEGDPSFQVSCTPDQVKLVEVLGLKLTQLLL